MFSLLFLPVLLRDLVEIFWVESWLVRLEGDTYSSTLAAGRKHVF